MWWHWEKNKFNKTNVTASHKFGDVKSASVEGLPVEYLELELHSVSRFKFKRALHL
jgi:hypothetical protein